MKQAQRADHRRRRCGPRRRAQGGDAQRRARRHLHRVADAVEVRRDHRQRRRQGPPARPVGSPARPPARRPRRRRHRRRDQGDRLADRRQPRHGVRQHGRARGLPRDRRGLHRHGDPRGSRRRVRGPAVVRQPRVEARRALRRPRRHGHPRRRVRPRRRQRLLRARRPTSTSTRSTRSTSSTSTPGSHGRYFATNFDPEINFREFVKVWTWIDRQWVEYPTHTVRREYDFPVVGRQPVYLNGHDELHSLSKHIDANSIRFWMGFGDHYINVFTVLRTLGLLSHEPVRVGDAGGGPAAGRQGRAARPADARRRLHRQDLHRQHRHRPEGRPPPRGVHLPDHRPRRGVRGGRVAGDQLHRRRAADRRGAAHRLRRVGRRSDGERRGARPGSVPRPARPDGPADRDARDRPGRRRPLRRHRRTAGDRDRQRRRRRRRSRPPIR